MFCWQGRIQPVKLGAISEIFSNQVSLRVHYCKRDEVYFTTLLRANNGRQNCLISQMLFSKLYKIMVNKITFVRFREAIAPIAPFGSGPVCWQRHTFLINGKTYKWQSVFENPLMKGRLVFFWNSGIKYIVAGKKHMPAKLTLNFVLEI